MLVYSSCKKKKKSYSSLSYLTQEIKLCVVLFNVVSDRHILSGWQILHKHLPGLDK